MQWLERIKTVFRRDALNIQLMGKDLSYLKEKFKLQQIENVDGFHVFPSSVSLSHHEVYANYLLVLLDCASFEKIKKVCLKYTGLNDWKLNQLYELFTRDFGYLIQTDADFNGFYVRIISNDVQMLNEIHQLQLEPPPPWLATDMQPVDVIFLQGKEEYYWHTFWLRFRKTLSEHEFQVYCEKNAIPEIWKDFLE